MPIVSNLLNWLANSSFVPTPSVLETMIGFLILNLLISTIDPKAPILSFLLSLSFF